MSSAGSPAAPPGMPSGRDGARKWRGTERPELLRGLLCPLGCTVASMESTRDEGQRGMSSSGVSRAPLKDA